MATTAQKIKALLVNVDDAGTQSVFVMINATTEGSDGNGGDIDVVKGLSFADGTNASDRTWNYIDDGLVHTANTADFDLGNNRGRYDYMVKFKIGEDGVLRSAAALSSTQKAGEYITGAVLDRTDDPYKAGSGGTFSLAIATGGGIGYVTFEADAVLYEIDEGSWVALRPNSGNFKDSDSNSATTDYYDFLKTDPDDKAYDIIIRR